VYSEFLNLSKRAIGTDGAYRHNFDPLVFLVYWTSLWIGNEKRAAFFNSPRLLGKIKKNPKKIVPKKSHKSGRKVPKKWLKSVRKVSQK